jgi:IS1 transposase
VKLYQWQDVEAEADEMWRFVGDKSQQRWLSHAINRHSGEILVSVLTTHEDEAFVKLKGLLEPFGIAQFLRMAGEPSTLMYANTGPRFLLPLSNENINS